MLRYDEELGWALNRNVLQRIRINGEQTITYRTNSLGYRGDEPKTPIVAVFAGDSYTFGMNSDTSYPEEFSRLTGIASANTAVMGYGTDQAFLSLKRFAESARATPKWVIYGFYKNDLLDNVSNKSLYTPAGILVHKPILDLSTDRYLPADVRDNDITGELRGPQSLDMILGLMMQSRFVWAVDKIRGAIVERGAAPFAITDQNRRYLGANLRNFAGYAQAKGARFVIVHVADRFGEKEMEIASMLQDFSTELGALYIRPDLQGPDYIPIDGHLSDAGARHIAADLADALVHDHVE
jgi:hypothetical protein